eukprot:scaffold1659_cov255-Pinguiococcus_pyrenoidosus.AAC.13
MDAFAAAEKLRLSGDAAGAIDAFSRGLNSPVFELKRRCLARWSLLKLADNTLTPTETELGDALARSDTFPEGCRFLTELLMRRERFAEAVSVAEAGLRCAKLSDLERAALLCAKLNGLARQSKFVEAEGIVRDLRAALQHSEVRHTDLKVRRWRLGPPPPKSGGSRVTTEDASYSRVVATGRDDRSRRRDEFHREPVAAHGKASGCGSDVQDDHSQHAAADERSICDAHRSRPRPVQLGSGASKAEQRRSGGGDAEGVRADRKHRAGELLGQVLAPSRPHLLRVEGLFGMRGVPFKGTN